MSLNYVMIGSNDVAKARPYYDAILPLTGGTIFADFMPHGVCHELRNGGHIWVAPPHNQEVAIPGNSNMVGLLCECEAEVRAVHAAELANGDSNEGDPSPRPQYGPNFYGAYAHDMDGSKMSFVYLGEES